MPIKCAAKQRRHHSTAYLIASVKKHATPMTRINDNNKNTSNNTMSEEINAKDVDHVDTHTDNDKMTTSNRRSHRITTKSKRVAKDSNAINAHKQLPSDHPQSHCMSDAMEQDVTLTHHADDAGEALTSENNNNDIINTDTNSPTNTTAATTTTKPSPSSNIQSVSNLCMYVLGVIIIY